MCFTLYCWGPGTMKGFSLKVETDLMFCVNKIIHPSRNSSNILSFYWDCAWTRFKSGMRPEKEFLHFALKCLPYSRSRMKLIDLSWYLGGHKIWSCSSTYDQWDNTYDQVNQPSAAILELNTASLMMTSSKHCCELSINLCLRSSIEIWISFRDYLP